MASSGHEEEERRVEDGRGKEWAEMKREERGGRVMYDSGEANSG